MSTNDKHKWYLASSDPTQSELNDAHSRGIHRDDYDCARKSGATHKEALDAHSKGINLYDYGFARESGATHNEALDAHSKGINIYGYAAAKAYGATHNEALDAHDRGLNLHNYRDARDTGATHNEALDAHSKGINLYDYVYARKHGVTHNEVLDAHDRGINLDHYGYARYHGATHNEALDAHSKGINIGDYAFAKRQNKTHYEILKNLIKDYNPYSEINWKNASSNPTQAELNDAAYRGLNILHYAEARNYGATHNEILDAHSKGIYLDDYAYAREHGATHNEILDADSKGINLYDYAAAKQKNKTHYEILKYLIPDYNPYSEINWKNASSDPTQAEKNEAHQKGIYLFDYGYARNNGANHNETLDAHSKGINLFDYGFARKCGANHNETLDAHSKDIGLEDYAYAREYDANHNEILDAHSKGIDLDDYALAKQQNKTHYEILKYLIPDYNPYSEINWKNASSDDDFGISKREQSEMAGRAIGEHIWDKMEDIFGPMKLQHQLHTVGELAKRFPDHIIQVDESDEPYVSHKVGDWEGRYFDGPYIEMHHVKHGPMEVIDVGREGDPSEGKDRKITPAELRGEVEHFIKHDAQQYVDSAEQNPRTSSSKQDFSGGTCLGCGTLLSTRMDSYCPTCTDIMSQSNDLDYMQTNPNHPEARPFQKPHDFSGNE